MKEPLSPTNSETPKARKLKIEPTGDFAAGKVKPQIRLKGNWLADAGFKPGKNVEVSVLKEGLLKLEVHEGQKEVPDD
jgi:type I toxin-antitoxin system toxin SymE